MLDSEAIRAAGQAHLLRTFQDTVVCQRSGCDAFPSSVLMPPRRPSQVTPVQSALKQEVKVAEDLVRARARCLHAAVAHAALQIARYKTEHSAYEAVAAKVRNAKPESADHAKAVKVHMQSSAAPRPALTRGRQPAHRMPRHSKPRSRSPRCARDRGGGALGSRDALARAQLLTRAAVAAVEQKARDAAQSLYKYQLLEAGELTSAAFRNADARHCRAAREGHRLRQALVRVARMGHSISHRPALHSRCACGRLGKH
jgi:hypothetical protein